MSAQLIAPGLGTDEETKVVVASGLSFTCAMCKHFWHARRTGRHGCGMKCTGPYGGGDFPKYDGPLVNGTATMVCFHCGDKSVAAFRIAGGKTFGCCQTHREQFKNWTPPGIRPRKNLAETKTEVIEK